MKNMKKYVIFILIIGALLGSVLIYNIIKINKEATKEFEESGYVLQASGEETKAQSVQRYYFAADGSYQNKYNEKVIFKDTDGENVKVNLENFIHYTNGSISAFTNGVLLDLKEIDQNPINYYNIRAGMTLKKQGDLYKITNLDKELSFSSLIWKISPQKYIIVGQNIKLVFEDGTNKEISGYVEIEYIDNEIVKIYNQETTYQTISSQVYIEMPDGIKINLASKIVSKNNENKMSLENMVIDSDDNVTIVDLNDNEEKKSEETNEEASEENEKTEQGTAGNAGNGGANTGSQITNEQNSQNGSTVINSGGSIAQGSGEELQPDQPGAITPPSYKLEQFNVNTIGLDATIKISDENNLLVEDTTIRIIKNSTGKKVYESVEPLGSYSIDISLTTLEPNTEYTLIAESSYKIDDMTYTKDFLSKVFTTEAIGINLEKDLFTNTTMQIAVKIDKDTKVKQAEVVLYDMSGNKLQSQTITHNPELATEEASYMVEFNGLTSNTTYKVSVINVLYDSQVITNGFELTKQYTTLKERPTISGTEFEINKRDSNFKLRIKNVQDKDKAITNYRFEIFDTRMAESDPQGNISFEGVEPTVTITSQNTETTVSIDDTKIFRNIGYAFRVVAIGNDNEKICEYESEYSNVFQMDGNEFPTVRFEEGEITYERIEGKLIVEDSGGTIHLTDDTVFTVTYTDSVGTIRSFTSQGSYVIPVSVNNLRANETYKFAVYTTVDLNDGNEPIEKCYIGGAIVKTGIPNNLKANFANNNADLKNVFKVNFNLQNEEENQRTLEAETLTGMVFSIYAGQTPEGSMPSGTPIRTVKVVDTNIAPYESTLKESYYDGVVEITPEFFGADNRDFRNQWYTITVTGAYDYTDYKNNLPIIDNVYNVKTSGYRPDLPTDTDNAVIVTPIRNRELENPREDLEPATIVGYKTKAVYDNTDLYAKRVIYRAYDANTNELIEEIVQEIGEDGVIPTGTFDVADGTPISTEDTDTLRRGNTYYFTYEMELDLDKDGVPETKYPYEDEDVILRSPVQSAEKQAPTFVVYPSTSDATTMTIKYKCTDIDNAISNNSELEIKIGTRIVDRKKIQTTGTTDFETITFENLSKGDLAVIAYQNLLKNQEAEDRTLISHEFEGLNTIRDISYTVSLDSNRVNINLKNSNDELGKIAALKIVFSAVDGTTVIEKDLKQMPDNNIIGINYNDLGALLKKETRVDVYAYYDTGITGYDLEEGHYVTYKKAQLSTAEQENYYSINASGKFVETTSIKGNIFNSIRTEGKLQLQNPINQRAVAVDLDYSENGFKYQGNVLLQQQINLEQVVCAGSNIIKFDLIIPGISLKNDNDEWEIQTELDNVSMRADILVEPKTYVKDQKIYIDIYETDENGSAQNFVKTEEKLINDFRDKVTIGGLTPKKYYFMKFRCNLILDDGSVVEKYLYDIDYQVTGRLYYFSTLANVGISNIQVQYEPVKYGEKYIDITYNLERVTGYTRIEYKLYHYNTKTKQYEIFKEVEPDKIFKAQMQKKISIDPGEGFIFGDKYKVEIIPIAEYETIDNPPTTETIELGKQEATFTFDKLNTPTIAIRGSRTPNGITYRITVYDEDRIIENDKYTIQVLDGNSNDITPEEYKGEHDVDTANNAITIQNVESSQSYKIIVKVNLDYDNDKTDLQYYEKQYTVAAVNEYGITIGDITPNQNMATPNKVDLIFNNSYKLTDVETIKYSIYNTNGYSQTVEEQFVPERVAIDGDEGDVYYTYTLNADLNAYGKYIIELQFIKENKLIETRTLEYVYRN